MPVDRAHHDRGDHRQPKRAQHVPLPAKPLVGARVRLQLARALGRIHRQTIERDPARRNGPERPSRIDPSRCGEPTATNLDDGDPRSHLDQRHQHERNRPGSRADLMSNAETADSRLETVADRERERHPGADPEHEQAPGDPADAGQGNTAVGPHLRRETAQQPEHETEGGEQGDQHEVVASGRDRVQVLEPQRTSARAAR